MQRIIVLAVFFILNTNCKFNEENNSLNNKTNTLQKIDYEIINVYPHDTSSYTQGLIFFNNRLYESTGLLGKSKIVEVDIKTGKFKNEMRIAHPQIFGEGITIIDDKIYQLTWRNNKVFVYDTITFKKINEFTWQEEGWGITNSNDTLIISTGSSNLYLVNPIDFKVFGVIPVTRNNIPVQNLNELEYINGYVYANEYLTDNILKIDLQSGKVEGLIDLSNLLGKSGINYDVEKYQNTTGNVLNGIAFDSKKNTLLVTGKLWPALFEIKF